jgi:predicted ATPase
MITHQRGNPFYLRELLRAVTVSDASPATANWQEAAAAGAQDVIFYLGARLRQLGPAATRLAQALAVLGDSCTLRHAAALAGQGAEDTSVTGWPSLPPVRRRR